MLIGLGSIDNEVGIGQQIHGMPSDSLVLLNLRKHSQIRVHSTHSSQRGRHARRHHHVLSLHQIWKRLLSRLGLSQSIFGDNSHITDSTELLIRHIRWRILNEFVLLFARGVEWDDNRELALVS